MKAPPDDEAQPAPPDPEAKGPPVDPIELGLAVLLVLLGLALVARKLDPGADSTPPSEADSIRKLIAVWKAGGGRAIVGALALVGVSALACCGYFLPRALKTLKAALNRRALGPPTVGLALVLYGLGVVLQAVALTGYHGPTLALEGESVRVPLSGALEARVEEGAVRFARLPRKDADPAPPEGSRVRAVLRWAQGSGTVEVLSGFREPAVTLNGKPLADGRTHEVWPGDTLAVGATSGRLEGGTWIERLARSVGGALISFLGLLLLLQVLEALRAKQAPPDEPGVSLLTRVGLVRAGFLHEVGRGVAGYLAFLPLYMVLLWLTQVLAQALGLAVESHSLVRALERDASSVLALLVVLQAVFMAPLWEELTYRGIGQPAFERCFGAGGAVLATALLFAVTHAGFSSLLPMFGLGVLFASLRLLSPTGSLVAPVTAHLLHNGLTVSLVLAIQRLGP